MCFSIFMPSSTVCLLNPYANRGRAARVQPALAAALQACQPAISLLVPQSVAQAQAMVAALPAGSRVLLAGGDGSLQPLLAALLAGEHELALLPLGTGNDVARALGVHGLSWQQALQQALQRPAQRMDIGQLRLADGSVHYFSSSLACGFDAAAGAQVSLMPAALPGMLRYALAALRQFAQLRSYSLSWAMDDAPPQAGQVLLASCLNTPTYASGMRLAPSAQVGDGLLHLVLAQNRGLIPTLLLFARLLAAGRHVGAGGVQLCRGRSLRVQAQNPGQNLPILLDGELMPPQPSFEVQILPRALPVLSLVPLASA